MRKKKKKRTFEVTRGQVFLALVVMAAALTAAYEIGMWVGGKRVIAAERAVIQQSDRPLHSKAPIPKKDSPSSESTDGAAEEQKETQHNDVKVRTASQIPIGGDLPIMPPEDQPKEQPQADRGSVKYTVQIGTFGSRQNAEDMVAKLKSYEYKSWLRPEQSAERTLYSVLVGGFNTRDEAKKFGDLLQGSLSFVSSYMVREIQE